MSLAPLAANPVERRLDAAAADRLGALPATLPAATWCVDIVPTAWLPVLAWAVSVDTWNPEWPLQDRRAAILQSVALHREKGTPAAVKRLLDALGAVYTYEEGPAPFTCRIAILNSSSVLPVLAGIPEAVNRVKRASVVCDVTAVAGVPGGQVRLGAGIGAARWAANALVLQVGALPAWEVP